MSLSDTDPNSGTPDPDDTDAEQALAADTPTSGPRGEDDTDAGEHEDDAELPPALKAKLDRERANRAEREAEELRAENRRLREEGAGGAQPAATRDLTEVQAQIEQDAIDLAHLRAASKRNTEEGVHARQALRLREQQEADRLQQEERLMLLEIPAHRKDTARRLWDKIKASGDFSKFGSIADVDRALDYKETVEERDKLRKENDRLKGKRPAATNGAKREDVPSTVGHVPPAPKDANKPHVMSREEFLSRVQALEESDDPHGERKARRLRLMRTSGEIVISK